MDLPGVEHSAVDELPGITPQLFGQRHPPPPCTCLELALRDLLLHPEPRRSILLLLPGPELLGLCMLLSEADGRIEDGGADWQVQLDVLDRDC